MELVSCLCVSRPERWGQLQRAILDFNNQTRPDRELVIVVEGRTDFHVAVTAFVSSLTLNAPVFVLPRFFSNVVDGLSFAATFASGTILTLWDDDNFNHPERLINQATVQAANQTAITVYENGFYYFHEKAELMPIRCFRPTVQLQNRVLPSTLMAKRRHFPVLDHNVRSQPCVQMLTLAVKNNQPIRVLNQFHHVIGVTPDAKDSRHLRSYSTHRNNAESTVCDVAYITEHKSELTEMLDKICWDNDTIAVDGSDGNAFTYVPNKKWPNTLYPITINTTVSNDEKTPQA